MDGSAEGTDNKPKEPLTPNSDWIMMTGKEFYRFIKSPEGKSRYFIMRDNLVIETSREQCSDWLSEQEHCEYLFVLVLGAVFLIVPS